MGVWMDRWMDSEWMDVWTDGCVDGRVDGWVDGWKEIVDFYNLGSFASGIIIPISAFLGQYLDTRFGRDWVEHTASGKGPELRPSQGTLF